MRIVLSYLGEEFECKLFNKKGEVIPLEIDGFRKVKIHHGIVTELSAGTFWWFQASPKSGISVRWYEITDEYPVGSLETLKTSVPTDFLAPERFKPEELRGYMEKGVSEANENSPDRYPQPLIDAIIDVVERARVDY